MVTLFEDYVIEFRENNKPNSQMLTKAYSGDIIDVKLYINKEGLSEQQKEIYNFNTDMSDVKFTNAKYLVKDNKNNFVLPPCNNCTPTLTNKLGKGSFSLGFLKPFKYIGTERISLSTEINFKIKVDEINTEDTLIIKFLSSKFKVNNLNNKYKEFKLPIFPVPPVVKNYDITTEEDQPITINLAAKNEKGNDYTYRIIDKPKKGHVLINGYSLIYTPNLNVNNLTSPKGLEKFTYIANVFAENKIDSAPGLITIDIIPVQDAPIISNISVELLASSPTTISQKQIMLVASDPDNDTVIFTIITQPSHGTLTGSGNTRTYTPNINYTGPDSFIYLAHRKSLSGLASQGTVSINVKENAEVNIDSTINKPVETNKDITEEVAEDKKETGVKQPIQTTKPVTITEQPTQTIKPENNSIITITENTQDGKTNTNINLYHYYAMLSVLNNLY